jgi:hypothetical protein
METKLQKNKMEMIRTKIGFKNLFVVESVGKEWRLGIILGRMNVRSGSSKFQP